MFAFACSLAPDAHGAAHKVMLHQQPADAFRYDWPDKIFVFCACALCCTVFGRWVPLAFCKQHPLGGRVYFQVNHIHAQHKQ